MGEGGTGRALWHEVRPPPATASDAARCGSRPTHDAHRAAWVSLRVNTGASWVVTVA
jgi:hypothetical protein